jgi:curved DNA-binding protein CbpA
MVPMNLDAGEVTHYAVLGIEETDSADDVRRAYYRLVRQHPPEADPEGFKKVREAYQVLSDAEQRKQYDAIRRFGETIRECMDRGLAAREADDPETAVREFRRALALEPSLTYVRNQLALALLEASQQEAALAQMRQVVEREPDSHVYRHNLGVIYAEMEYDDAAMSAFRRAVELDRLAIDSLMALARLLWRQERRNEAVEAVNQAINADGVENFQDFPLLQHLTEMQLIYDDGNEADQTIARILKVVPDDPDAKAYAAHSLAYSGWQAYQEYAFSPALRLVEAARAIEPLEQIESLFEVVRVLPGLAEEYDRMKDDVSVPEPLRHLLITDFLEMLPRAETEDEEETDWAEHRKDWIDIIAHELDSSETRLKSYQWGCQQVRRCYPTFAEVGAAYLDRLENLEQQSSNEQQTTSSSGDCYIVTATMGTTLGPEVATMRWWRDHWLRKSEAGRNLILIYERVGPRLAIIISRSPCLRALSRLLLTLAFCVVQWHVALLQTTAPDGSVDRSDGSGSSGRT